MFNSPVAAGIPAEYRTSSLYRHGRRPHPLVCARNPSPAPTQPLTYIFLGQICGEDAQLDPVIVSRVYYAGHFRKHPSPPEIMGVLL